MKHVTPEWMDEFLERHEIEDLEEIYELVEKSPQDFWEEFWEKPRETTLERWIEEAERKEEFFQEYREVVKGKEPAIVKVDLREEKVQAYIKRSDGVVQRYWVSIDNLPQYRVAPKSGYLWGRA